jgi:maltose alpha-D-glucosyltransferase/alpha-amylase
MSRRHTSSTISADAQWYRDAIIYQLHVKSFCDSDGDGIGDFAGLMEKLDYIAELGVDTIWLLPFYPSPRRDDGYDIADYRGVHPDYGTMADLRRLIAGAHDRGIRVIIELVINHTSDQHPWFKRARRARPGSSARNFYIWSDTDERHADTRIIFTDSEKSNWTWDPLAGAYFWHRFYSHQPDLNFDNPRVMAEVLGILRFWLDLGVDGLRLDAVPYLVERDGTNNENLPETHAVLKRIRAAMDAHAPGRVLLAEANQWPEDTRPYFGDGDECNMAFHFPLMPRMYMAIAQEDRFPITDILRQTPDLPDGCQWVVFLRNHDELTLEMVTDTERDFLWSTYAADRRARLNMGIRRRLAPLLERDRRRMELMNGLLLSLPGTPVIYYGDEIGMGDNVHLGDRDGVRTPMQWSPDRNGGFSRASPEQLVLPAIMGPIYGFAAVNVEAQQADRHSLLNWMRGLLAVRKRHRAFGRGSLDFLYPGNRKVMAFLRQFEDQTILCVNNLSRTAQAVELDLSRLAGRTPIDLVGGSIFPPVGQLPYMLTLPPYAFYWFMLADAGALPPWHRPVPESLPDYRTLVLRTGIAEVLETPARQVLEAEILPPYLALRRWFAAKDDRITGVRLLRAAIIRHGNAEIILSDAEVQLKDRIETYVLPLTIVWDDQAAAPLPRQLALARVRRGRRVGFLTDAFAADTLPYAVLRLLREAAVLEVGGDEIHCQPTPRLAETDIPDDAPVRHLAAEQSNSSLVIGNAAVLKLLRRTTEGIHPEIEMTRHLTSVGYANTPPLLGEVSRVAADGTTSALVILQAFVFNQGDAWAWSQAFLTRTADEVAIVAGDASPAAAPGYSVLAGMIGQRLAELHAVLSRPSEDPAFVPEVATVGDSAGWATEVAAQIDAALRSVGSIETWPNEQSAEDAVWVTRHKDALHAATQRLAGAGIGALKTRIHGDFHLGQVLVTQGDAFLIDFEGEPARPVAERRIKTSPMRDVAGMLRSFEYAHAIAGRASTELPPKAAQRRIEVIDRLHHAATDAFLEAYRRAHDQAERRWVAPEAEAALLDLFLLQKAAYEICYEAANRVDWLPVPLHGLAVLAKRLIDRDIADGQSGDRG